MIIDAFIFYNELELLEKRLEYLYDSVDYFAVVESNYTHSGIEKPLNFLRNRSRFAKYLDKVLYYPLIIDPSNYNFGQKVDKFDSGSEHWRFENAQRNAIADAVKSFSPNDVVFISDLDEIPDKNMFGLIMDELKTTDILALVHRFFYYNLNCMFDGPWFGPMVTKKHILDHTSPQKVREHAIVAKRIQYGGWHLSYFFGENAIKTKLQSFAHQEWNQDYWLNPERIKKCIEEKKDIFERENHPPLIEPPLEIFPEDFLKVFRQYRRPF